jgi:hypothetical protein
MIAQIAIMVFGSLAIYLVSRTDKYQRWGYIMGLLGQPFWMYVTYTSEQWGILIMSIVYTYSWCNGIWNYWIKPYLRKEKLKDEISDIKELKQVWFDAPTKINPLFDPKTGEVEINSDIMEKCECNGTGVESTDFAYEYKPCKCRLVEGL